MEVNQVVKWKDPQSQDEYAERFVVRELRGDRVLVEFVCDMAIKPTFVYMAANLEVE